MTKQLSIKSAFLCMGSLPAGIGSSHLPQP
uniref:Uncharacterized protein n=1 Tax=Anguilla anguilla TaxID=7936 RepID=A0A0E9T726_ANGAN